MVNSRHASSMAATFARGARLHLKWIWLEHGTWATLWTAFGLGALVAWPPTWVTAATLVGLSAVAAAKVLAPRVHRGQVNVWVAVGLLLAAAVSLLPLLRSAPWPVLAVGVPGSLFLAVYFQASGSVRWTRTFAVELLGIALMSSAAGLAVLSARPEAWREAAVVWGLAAALFVPAVPRAKLMKAGTAGLRIMLFAAAAVGLAAFALLALSGRVAWWGGLAGLVFVGDLRAGLLMPRVSTKHLGVVLTLRNAAAALLVALAWQPF